MKTFSSIYETILIDGPALVNVKTAALYINPFEWRKLGDTAKKFVILHELGHLNAAEDSEIAADKWAFWHSVELGENNIALLKDFYDALFNKEREVTQEQIERGEQMLHCVLTEAVANDNEIATQIWEIIKAPANTDDVRGFIGLITAGASAAVGLANTLIKNRKAKKEQEKINEANEKAEKELLHTQAQQTAMAQGEAQMLAKLEEEAALVQQLAESKKSKQNTTIIIAGVAIILIALGIYFWKRTIN